MNLQRTSEDYKDHVVTLAPVYTFSWTSLEPYQILASSRRRGAAWPCPCQAQWRAPLGRRTCTCSSRTCCTSPSPISHLVATGFVSHGHMDPLRALQGEGSCVYCKDGMDWVACSPSWWNQWSAPPPSIHICHLAQGRHISHDVVHDRAR